METRIDIDDYLLPGTADDVRAWYASLPAKAQESFELFEDEVVVVDTETTGTNPVEDSLIEIAACILRGSEIVDTFQTFVDPGRRIPAEITELTGITNADVAGAPDPSLAVEMFASFADGRDLVAHNASFDREFVMRQASPGAITGAWLDSLAMARIVLPRFKSHRLKDLSTAFGLHASTHRALDDVKATAQLWRIILAGSYQMEPGLAGRIAELSPQTEWPLRVLFSRAAISDGDARFSLRRCRDQRIKSKGISFAREDEASLVIVPSDEEIHEAFSAAGVAGRMHENYEPRVEQLDMALEVTSALRDGTHRVLEAGTGVGKSMAYLLPGALTAKASGMPLGIATKTNALLDQLIYHELPRLDKALGGLSYLALKGYDHYPCLRKLESFSRDEDESKPEVIEMTAMLLSFTAQTDWGDLDAVNLFWAGLPRYAIEASANDCMKNRCPFYPQRCFLRGARIKANSADVVVTNHALLFRDIQADNGILPPIKHWVVDEAHAVEGEARRQLSHNVSARDLDLLLQRLTSGRNGIITQIRRKAGEVDGGTMLFGCLQDAEDRVLQIEGIATSFFSFVKDLDAVNPDRNSSYDRVTLWVSPKVRESLEWAMVVNPGRSLSNKLDELIARLRDLTTMVEQFEEMGSLQADLANTSCNLQEISQALDLILDGENLDYVYSVEMNRATERPSEVLTAMRIDIGDALADDFYPNTSSVIYTSATLATGDNRDPFRYFCHSVGIDQLPQEKSVCRQMASSYDFDRNMRILLPQGIKDPRAAGYQDDLYQLLLDVHLAMGGSVLTLFTNRREMEQLYYQLKPELHAQGIELIAQTRGTSTKGLRDRFLADEKLCLFALKSFWEGFDAPGETLRCVVIPKLPFGRPNDPLIEERSLREASVWGKYSLPEAVMDLKQAAGRLIRNSTDSGWLILADARLQTKGYGRTFLNAMPSKNIRTVPMSQIGRVIREEDE